MDNKAGFKNLVLWNFLSEMENLMEEKRVCKKCLLRENGEMPPDLESYIESITLDDRTPDDEYERRLSVCKSCANLLEGTCLACGCYVEVRAAFRVKKCPLFPPRWTICTEDL